jgi:hypothetical protein
VLQQRRAKRRSEAACTSRGIARRFAPAEAQPDGSAGKGGSSAVLDITAGGCLVGLYCTQQHRQVKEALLMCHLDEWSVWPRSPTRPSRYGRESGPTSGAVVKLNSAREADGKVRGPAISACIRGAGSCKAQVELPVPALDTEGGCWWRHMLCKQNRRFTEQEDVLHSSRNL